MAATPYSLRYLLNRTLIGYDEWYGKGIPIQSNLEKYARAMRYAQRTVQYYSPRYDYLFVSREANEKAKRLFGDNEFGK